MRDQVLVQAQGAARSRSPPAWRSALSDRTVDGSAGDRRRADRVRYRSRRACRTATRSSIDLHRQCDQHAAHASHSCASTIPTPCRCPDTATAESERQGDRHRFLRRLPASVAASSTPRSATTGLQFSNPAGTTLRVLDDGALQQGRRELRSRPTKTATSLTGGTAELPFFLDASYALYRRDHVDGSQSVGFAGRIAVNASLLADPSQLVVYQTSPLTPAGDGDAAELSSTIRLGNASLTFSPRSGHRHDHGAVHRHAAVFHAPGVSQQGEAAEAADNLKQGQDVVFNALQQRFNDAAGVNIDQEMANLLNLQNSYAANARVLSAVKDMIDTLMQDVRDAMSITGIGSQIGAGGAVAGRHAPAARRPAAPARHRHRSPTPMPASASIAASRSACAPSCPRSTAYDDTISNVERPPQIWRKPRSAASRDIGHAMQDAALQTAEHRQQRPDARAVDRAYPARRDAGPAQHPGRRPLSVFRHALRSAVGRKPRPHHEWRWRARRPQADHCRAQPGRPRRQRPRPAGGFGADRDLGRLAEDAAGSPFGFKLAGVNSTLTDATVAGPTGVAARAFRSISTGQSASDGESVQFRFTLPDGTSEEPHADGDHVGNARRPTSSPSAPTPAATAANLQAALTSVARQARQRPRWPRPRRWRPATNSSAIRRSASPAPPFDTATSLVAGTPAEP